ncbi:hypothetical protein DMP23_07260 [Amycolatopsis sp. A1MSW2902]|uniref:hypothetical protein n=1 Tax=Amycolatopsis sp. A1MSW2902 TaxID=687413 RepID=UPI00307D337F
MTVPPENTDPLDDDHAGRVERVEFGAAVAPARGGKRIATRDEMLAAATKVFARRGPGRHRKPVARGRWVCAASETLSWLAPVLWRCLQLSFAASVISAVALLISLWGSRSRFMDLTWSVHVRWTGHDRRLWRCVCSI